MHIFDLVKQVCFYTNQLITHATAKTYHMYMARMIRVDTMNKYKRTPFRARQEGLVQPSRSPQ
jgi:hypothetical protein